MLGPVADIHTTPVLIHEENIKQVEAYRYLGVWIDKTLSWRDHIDVISMQIIYFLHRLRSFGARKQILLLFFMSVIMSVLQYCNSVWYMSLSVSLKTKLMNLLEMCSKIVGQPLQKVYELSYHNNLVRLANNIVSEPNHVLYNEFVLLPSNRRYKVPRYS